MGDTILAGAIVTRMGQDRRRRAWRSSALAERSRARWAAEPRTRHDQYCEAFYFLNGTCALSAENGAGYIATSDDLLHANELIRGAEMRVERQTQCVERIQRDAGDEKALLPITLLKLMRESLRLMRVHSDGIQACVAARASSATWADASRPPISSAGA